MRHHTLLLTRPYSHALTHTPITHCCTRIHVILDFHSGTVRIWQRALHKHTAIIYALRHCCHSAIGKHTKNTARFIIRTYYVRTRPYVIL